MYNIIRFVIDESLCIFIYGVIIFMVHCNNTVVSKIVTVIRAKCYNDDINLKTSKDCITTNEVAMKTVIHFPF